MSRFSLSLSQHSNSSTRTPFSAWNLGLEVTVTRKIQFDPDCLIQRSAWKGFLRSSPRSGHLAYMICCVPVLRYVHRQAGRPLNLPPPKSARAGFSLARLGDPGPSVDRGCANFAPTTF